MLKKALCLLLCCAMLLPVAAQAAEVGQSITCYGDDLTSEQFQQVVELLDADLAAAQIAAKIGAKKLILMTDIRGLLRDVNDDKSLISVVNVSEVPMLKREGIIKGGMIPKIDCCVSGATASNPVYI